jgi:hypothetical protein
MYRRYGGDSRSEKPTLARALRLLGRSATIRTEDAAGTGRLFLVDNPVDSDDQRVPLPGHPAPIRREGADAQRGEPRRNWWALRFLRRPPGPREPGERYKIDPQFVPRALERVP